MRATGYRRLLFAIAALPCSLLPLSTSAQTAAEQNAPATTAFERRTAQLPDVVAGNIAFDDYFAPLFRAEVPQSRFAEITRSLIAQYGRPLGVESAQSADGRSGTLKLRFEKGTATVRLDVGATADERVTGLLITGFTVDGDDFHHIAADLEGLRGATGFLVAEIDGNAIRTIASANADRQYAVGSTFKLYILDELAAQIAAGKRRWRDVVLLSHSSFSSAATANWPKDTPVTLQTLANWMISVSDNGAADTLLHLLGRDAIEARMRAAGHSEPSRNIPFLSTVEAFALKGNNFTAERAAFIGADDKAQRRLIDANAGRLTLANVDGVSFTAGPRFIGELEWFASPRDIARLMADLRRRNSAPMMAAMAINSGVGPVAAEPWRYLGYKGGSENGVLSMSLLGQRKSDGKWFVVTASWNNPEANVETDRLVGLVRRLLALAAK
jgi:hypothetical protein